MIAMVSMIPFGLLAGVVGGREVRITEIDESGFCFRTIEENISDSEALKAVSYTHLDVYKRQV